MKKIPENTMLLARSVGPVIFIIFLFLLLGYFALNKINQIRSQITEIKQKNAVLTEKLDLLRSVALTGVVDSNEAANSLPESNPALAVVSQLKTLASNNGLILGTLKTKSNPSDTENINSVTISFNVVGGRSEVENFLLDINNIAPITQLNKLILKETTGTVEGDVSVDSYWSALPKVLPTNIEDFQALTTEEKEVLAKVRNLTQPVLVELPPPDGGSGKEDPFNN